MELAEKLTNTTFLFYCSKKCKFMFVSVSASFILLQIGENWHTKCQGHKKRLNQEKMTPFFKFEGLTLPCLHRLYLG